MTRFSRLAACGLVLLQPLAANCDLAFQQPLVAASDLELQQPLAAACALSDPDSLCSSTRRDLTPEQAQRELGPLLSNTSSIFGPSDPRWLDATERYQLYAVPDIQMVVQPRLESDIPKIVGVTVVAHQCAVGTYNNRKRWLIHNRSNMPTAIASHSWWLIVGIP